MKFLNEKKSRLQLFKGRRVGSVSMIISLRSTLLEMRVWRRYSGGYKVTIKTSPEGEILDQWCEYVDPETSYSKDNVTSGEILDCLLLIDKAPWKSDDAARPFIESVLKILDKVQNTL